MYTLLSHGTSGRLMHAHWEPYHTFFREGSEIKWLRSETFLFWRAAGEEKIALVPPNKQFPLIFKWDKVL